MNSIHEITTLWETWTRALDNIARLDSHQWQELADDMEQIRRYAQHKADERAEEEVRIAWSKP
jgi:hypothetical protein